LEELKSQQKELGQQIKVMEPELEVIKTKKDYIMGQKKQLDSHVKQLEQSRSKLVTLVSKRDTVNEQLLRLSTLSQQASSLTADVARTEAIMREVGAKQASFRQVLGSACCTVLSDDGCTGRGSRNGRRRRCAASAASAV
jgi:chromosome segregation ATPase